MPESDLHQVYVRQMLEEIKNESDGCQLLMYADLPEFTGNRPRIVNGYIPDICVHNLKTDRCVVGEAETAGYMQREHTKMQVEAFHRGCSEGGWELWLCVAFVDYVTAVNLLKKLNSNAGSDVKFKVLIGHNV